MSGPQNATTRGDGFRAYRWEPADGSAPTEVLSVTSIRRLCGEPFSLVAWQIENVLDVAMSTMQRIVIGPRGGVSKKRVKDEYPGEFVRRYQESAGDQKKLDDLRSWAREQADEPRNIAARRGSIAHRAFEMSVQWDRIERPYVEAEFAKLSQRDRKRAKAGVTDEDVRFVRHTVRQYWHMRKALPFVIVAREPQVWNLTAGYAGSADTIIWFLPEGTETHVVESWQRKADRFQLTLDDIIAIGGYLAVGDWKTAADIYTDNVVQVMAYGAAEFVGSNGVVDERLTRILNATTKGVLFHLRPNGWAVDVFDFAKPIIYAFVGSVAFARFLATNPTPTALFTQTYSGNAGEEE